MADRLDFQQLSFGVRRMGWIRFWIQVVLGVVVVGVLLFNNVGGSLARNAERAVGLGPGLSLTTLAFLVLLYSLLAALYVLAISLAGSITSLGPTGFGSLLAMSGLGMAVGAVLTAQLGHRFSRRLLTAAGLGTITWSLLLLSQFKGSLSGTLGLCGILGVGAALVAIPAQTTIQEDTPESQRGRVFGLQNNLINIALSLPLVLAGALVSSIGLLPVLWVLAALALIAAVIERPWQRC